MEIEMKRASTGALSLLLSIEIAKHGLNRAISCGKTRSKLALPL